MVLRNPPADGNGRNIMPSSSVIGYNRSFQNEMDSRIVVDLERNDTLGIVRIFIGGPKSDGTWRLTPKEAEELRDGLTVILGFEPR